MSRSKFRFKPQTDLAEADFQKGLDVCTNVALMFLQHGYTLDAAQWVAFLR